MSKLSLKQNSVAIIANGFNPEYIIGFTNGLAKNGVRAEVLGSDIYNPNQFDTSVKFFNIRGSHADNVHKLKKIKRILIYYKNLLRYLIDTNINIFHIKWLRFDFIDGLFFNILFKMCGKKLIYTAHNIMPHDKANFLKKLNFLFIYHLVDIIVVHTKYIRFDLINIFKIKPNKIIVLEHGLNPIPKSNLVSKYCAKNRLNLSKKIYIVLFFGSIEKYKRIKVLINAMELVNKEISDVELLLAGKVKKRYLDNFNRIMKDDYLSFIIKRLEFINEDEVEYYFRACDIVVLPYYQKSQSGVLFLAYKYGKYVIVPNKGPLKDYVLEGKTGYTFEMDNSEDLAKKIKKFFINNKAEFEDEIFNHISLNYSWDKTLKKVISIYN